MNSIIKDMSSRQRQEYTRAGESLRSVPATEGGGNGG